MDALAVWTGCRNKVWSQHLTKFKLRLNKLREEGGFGLNTARRLVYRDCGAEWISLGGSFWERHQDGSLRPMPDVSLVSYCQNSLKNHQQGRVQKAKVQPAILSVSAKLEQETEVEETIGSFELDSMDDEEPNDRNIQEAATGDVSAPTEQNNNNHSRTADNETTGITEAFQPHLLRRSQRLNKGVHRKKFETSSSPSEEIVLEEETVLEEVEETVLKEVDNDEPPPLPLPVRVSKRERKKKTFFGDDEEYLPPPKKKKKKTSRFVDAMVYIHPVRGPTETIPDTTIRKFKALGLSADCISFLSIEYRQWKA